MYIYHAVQYQNFNTRYRIHKCARKRLVVTTFQTDASTVAVRDFERPETNLAFGRDGS